MDPGDYVPTGPIGVGGIIFIVVSLICSVIFGRSNKNSQSEDSRLN